MRFQVQLEWRDVFQAAMVNMRPSWRRVAGTLLVLVIGVILAGWIFDIDFRVQAEFSSLLVCLVFGICLLGSVPLLSAYAFISRFFWRGFAEVPQLAAPTEYELTDEALKITSGDASAIWPWSQFAKCKEGRKVIVLYHKDNTVRVLPKRAFEDASQMDFLKARLNIHRPTHG